MNNQIENTELADTSQTSGSSTGGTTPVSTGVPRGWLRWTTEELLKIQSQEIRDGFYLALRHSTIDDFMAEHFPNRTRQAVQGKIWRYERNKDRNFFPKTNSTK